ncbi:VWA domain-containing protein [Myxococcota bacterium]|nr:VWA domain-containing protein [Myxococcota bacterium]MBU1537011.1 VWA domain-containing protein [Myxococcota bacterium]
MSWLGLSGGFMLQAFGIFAGLIGLMYLLKMRERLVPVSAHFLWERVLKAGQRSLIARILRRVFSFLLQILILLTVLLTMGDPRPKKASVKAQRTVILIDESASMKTTDMPPVDDEPRSRWQKAIELARKVVISKNPRDEMLIVTFSGMPVPQSAWETEETSLLSALARIKPRDTPGDLEAGLRYVSEILYKEKNSKVVVISDGALPEDKGLYWPPVPKECKDITKRVDLTGLNIEMLRVTPKSETVNLAITSLAARPLPTDTETGEVLVRAMNFGKKSVKARIDLYVDGNWRESRSFSFSGGEEVFLLLRLPLVGTDLEARLKAIDGTEDPLELDNRAWAVLPKKPDPRVLLVGRENLFLEAAALLIPGYFEKITPDEYDPSVVKNCAEEGGAPCNLIIFNDFVPSVLPPTQNQLYINPQGKPFTVAQEVKQNLQIMWTGGKKKHPIMEGVSMKDVNMWGVSSAFTRQKGDVSLMQVDARGTIFGILHHMKDGRRMVGLGFSLKDSDFVLQISFPVFMLNLVNWFMGTSPGFLATHPTGIPQRFALDSDSIVYPDGFNLEIPGRNLTFRPDYVGVYTFNKNKEVVRKIAASLLSQTESDNTPKPIMISCKKPAPWKAPAIIVAKKHSIPWKILLMILLAGVGMLIMTYLRGVWGAILAFLGILTLGLFALGLLLLLGFPPWMALILTTFLILVLEWFTYNRRITV